MPSIVPLDSSLGAEFIGIIISTVCVAQLSLCTPKIDHRNSSIYGISCLQVYLYYTEHSTRDPKFLKIFVSRSDDLAQNYDI